MQTLSELFRQSWPNSDNRYVKLLKVVAGSGPYGRFIRLICEDDDGLPLEALADEKRLNHLEPYYKLLQQSQENTAYETPVIPVFLDQSNHLRFSWRTAEQDYPELKGMAKNTEPLGPPEHDRPFRLQVTVSHSLVKAFDRVAANQGLRRQELLLRLVQDALS
jgi:hypothetical protein